MIQRNEHPIHPDYSILTTNYQPNWKDLLIFEAIGLFGRLFLTRTAPKAKNDANFLHLGCGTNQIPGWVNADFYRVRFWRKNKPQWQLDLRFPLKCKDNYWDGVFTEHTLEHLTPAQVLNLLRELYRTMKPGAYLRICVPGLEQSITPYLNGGDTSENGLEMRNRYPDLATAIWGLTQTWGHYSVWNGALFKDFLLTAGFSQATEVAYREGSDQRIIQDSANRKLGSLYMEARK